MDSKNGLVEKIVSLPQNESVLNNFWVDDFVEATSAVSSPELFRRWSAIMAVAGALERKVWVRTKASNLYPNLYVVICAPPGIGKTEIISYTRDMWTSLDEHHVANSSVTKAALIDSLATASRKIIRPLDTNPVYSFNSLLIGSNELGVLLPAYDSEFMNTLTDLYDGKNYSESRRTKDLKIKIENPNLNMLAGCTPGYLRETLPPGAWDQGFLSRVILIYNGEIQLQSLFLEDDEISQMSQLKTRLKTISEKFGPYTFTEEARAFIDHWHLNGQAPRPDHPRLAHYLTRRTAHLLKLSMIAAASSSISLVIEKSHIQRAMLWLFEAEFYMTDIFKAMATGGDSQVIEDTFHHLYTLYLREGQKPIAEHRLVHFLQERTPAHNIVRVLEIMERAKMIEKKIVPKLGVAYVPVKAPRD
jgi:hypothetical protein